jgi:3-hydroxybutyryl-CoA dehydrogenase
MKVVEVIGGALTASDVVHALSAFARELGHRPVVASDTPGFIVNHAGRGYASEALEILREGVAPLAVIDRILRNAADFKMGPFELLDLIGLDVSHPVMETIYAQYYHEPRFRPSGIARQRLAAGLLGRKSGRGFYEYAGGTRLEGVDDSAQFLSADLPGSVRIVGGPGTETVERLCRQAGARISDHGELTILPLIGDDASSACVENGIDPARAVGFDPLFGLESHRTLVATPATTAIARAQALALFRVDGVRADLVEDSAGAICQRVVATIINIACAMVQQRIASAEDLDAAVRLGLGYPNGPLAWGDALGPSAVLSILRKVYGITGDPRYRPSLYLKRRAELGLKLTD